MNLKDFKKEIDPLINEFIQNKIDGIPDDKNLAFLKDYFEYLKIFLRDGKRIRPYMAFLTYQAFEGKNSKDIIKLLVFIEIFHTFCLVHDDIIDNSTKRHGIDTLHEKIGKTNSNKLGIPHAILIGDYLFAWSWEIIINSSLNPTLSKDLMKLFSEMIEEVFLGQEIDVQITGEKIVADRLIEKKTLYKTAGYSFVKPMLIGALLSGRLDKKTVKFCNDLGNALGVAFQVRDDLLDITSSFEGNKTTLSDVTNHQHTIFTNYVLKNGTSEQKELLRRYFGKEIHVRSVNKIRKLFYDSGAVNYGEKIIADNIDKANKLIGTQDLRKYKKDFYTLTMLISSRNS